MASDAEFGSLAQSARLKQLNTARAILIVVGALTMIANAVLFTMIEEGVEKGLREEEQQLRRQGMIIDRAEYERLRSSAIRTAKVLQAGAVALGLVFVVLGIMVKTYPVPSTVTALVLYIGAAALFGFLDPRTLLQGLLIKILIVFGLFKSVQAAKAYESESGQLAAGYDSPEPPDDATSPEVDVE